MEDAKRINRKEAAQMLGICTESVSNLVRSGALTVIKKGKWYYFNRDEVEALVPKCEGIRDIESAIRDVEDELLEEEKRRIGEVRVQRARREYIEKIAGSVSRFHRYHDVVITLYEAVAKSGLCGDFDEREMDIVSRVLNFDSLYEISKGYGLTQARIMQLFNRALRRITHFSHTITENYKSALDENEGLRIENASLLDANKLLRSELQSAKPRGEKPGSFINSDLSEHGLSPRSFHCLRAIGVKTLADLVKMNRKDLMKCRNFGKKSLDETERLLERYGLHFSMNIYDEDE